MNNVAVVIRNYNSAFPDPISITKNDTAVISHCDLVYPGWIWVTLPSGKAGWAPQQIFSPLSSNEVICLADYTAHELSVSFNEKITVIKSLNGWYWALKHSGESGWVPEECVNLLSI
ncbi:SH3 domain-containing protein [Ewingella americana]|uniref:Ligand-binding protein SH3 n=1 Tax=Ewingella americana TaxID=41202 RepID=A0A502GL52_9GAMM|nr:SH3 domain-containing protein [Ewingella americana]TPG62541.1 ligand-binding protein SH3 [Ewingella americana]